MDSCSTRPVRALSNSHAEKHGPGLPHEERARQRGWGNGWVDPFGDRDKARALLQQALKIDPTGSDANHFYGEFLMEGGDHDKAVDYLKRAQAAPPRPGREDADAGRRTEIEALLKKLES